MVAGKRHTLVFLYRFLYRFGGSLSTSRDAEDVSGDICVVSPDTGLMSGDIEAVSGDMSLGSPDIAAMSGNTGLMSGDIGLGSGDIAALVYFFSRKNARVPTIVFVKGLTALVIVV